ncbi:MAG: hypothetical protein C4519_27370 [Desulfobacteraceae bacterium]|nr:MAG: hypothetical protein C4519_27370 [Desulfobacteraceae bacterium]
MVVVVVASVRMKTLLPHPISKAGSLGTRRTDAFDEPLFLVIRQFRGFHESSLCLPSAGRPAAPISGSAQGVRSACLTFKKEMIMLHTRSLIGWVLWIVCFILVLLAGASYAVADENGCQYCGMKKAMFAHSWVTVEREDGSSTGVCSVHCAAIDMALKIDNPAKKILVGDYNTKKPIDAETAYWVVGGNKMGVMTKRAKWAFESKAAADAFVQENGGQPAAFEQVMKAAFEDMYEDILMIQKKRKMMRMKKEGS